MSIQSKEPLDWAVRCNTEGDKRCYLVQNVFLEDNQQRLVSLGVGLQGQNYFALLSVPLGVNLPANAQLQVDDLKPVTVAYQLCIQNGCYGGATLSPTQFKSLKQGKKLMINFQDPAGRRIGVPLSLKDFNLGLKELQATTLTQLP